MSKNDQPENLSSQVVFFNTMISNQLLLFLEIRHLEMQINLLLSISNVKLIDGYLLLRVKIKSSIFWTPHVNVLSKP